MRHKIFRTQTAQDDRNSTWDTSPPGLKRPKMTETQNGDTRSPELKLPKLVVRWLAGPRPNKDRHARSDTMGDDRMHRLTTCLKRLCPLTNIYPRT